MRKLTTQEKYIGALLVVLAIYSFIEVIMYGDIIGAVLFICSFISILVFEFNILFG